MIRMVAILGLLCSALALFMVWQVNKQNVTLNQAQAQTSESNDILQTIPIPQVTITFLPSPKEPSESSSDPSTNVTPSAETNLTNTAKQTAPLEITQDAVIATTACSSLDQAGLLGAFDRELGIFLNNAAATYGSQYSNLQYTVSNQQIAQNGEQGSVSANYQGSVSEIATGQTISASGGMSVNFAWDGCYWQMLDYSYF